MFKKLTFKTTRAHKFKSYMLGRAHSVLCALIRFYQNFLSPSLGKNCRFYPSCSEYTYHTIEKYGLLKGGWKGFKRILKCYPWHSGGIDLP